LHLWTIPHTLRLWKSAGPRIGVRETLGGRPGGSFLVVAAELENRIVVNKPEAKLLEPALAAHRHPAARVPLAVECQPPELRSLTPRNITGLALCYGRGRPQHRHRLIIVPDTRVGIRASRDFRESSRIAFMISPLCIVRGSPSRPCRTALQRRRRLRAVVLEAPPGSPAAVRLACSIAA